MYLLSIESVCKSYSNHDVLRGIDLHVSAGECLALLGPNGAGKSTTIQIALGLTRQDQGSVEALGFDMASSSHLARQGIGVVPQYDGLDPDFTVRENLEVFGGYFGLTKRSSRSHYDELLAFASLSSRQNDSVQSLSGGMKRRLSLARALVNRPRLLFLDEPTTALDPQAKHLIWEKLISLKRRGIGIFLTTHFMDEAQRLADTIAVLDGGRIIAKGSPKELIDRYVGGFVLEVWGIDNLSDFLIDKLRNFFTNNPFDILNEDVDSGSISSNGIDKNVDCVNNTSSVIDWNVNREIGSSDVVGKNGNSVYASIGFMNNRLDINGNLVEIEMRGESIFVTGPSSLNVFEALQQISHPTLQFLYRPANLEDVFFKLTGRDLRDA